MKWSFDAFGFDAKEFKESDHPRKEDGEFTSGGGSKGKVEEGKSRSKKAIINDLEKQRKKLHSLEHQTGVPKPGNEAKYETATNELKKLNKEFLDVVAGGSEKEQKAQKEAKKELSNLMNPDIASVAIKNVFDIWQEKYDDKMSLVEAGTISGYCSDAYRPLNKGLRSGEPSAKIKQLERALNESLDKLPPFKGTTYRGARLPKDKIAKYQVGRTITDPAFLSTSKDEDRAQSGQLGNEKKEDNISFVIEGRSGRIVTDLSDNFVEEVLFKSKTKFQIVSNDGKTIVLKEV